MGRKEEGTLWGRAVLGLAPLKEPLSVSKRGWRDLGTRGGIFWCLLGGSGCRWGVVTVKHPVYQDGWCWRAVSRQRNWNNGTGTGKAAK